jgi:hypothetical protein
MSNIELKPLNNKQSQTLTNQEMSSILGGLFNSSRSRSERNDKTIKDSFNDNISNVNTRGGNIYADPETVTIK